MAAWIYQRGWIAVKYLIEPIGSAFSTRDMQGLGERFTAKSREGYELHSVFQVTQTGCLGMQTGSTYLAVYAKRD